MRLKLAVMVLLNAAWVFIAQAVLPSAARTLAFAVAVAVAASARVCRSSAARPRRVPAPPSPRHGGTVSTGMLCPGTPFALPAVRSVPARPYGR